MSLILSFDIGYASIGWCVLSSSDKKSDPEFLGTGVVTFPTDDCLASKRRDLRRTRRHIRSTRQRIERMKRWLVHRGVLSRTDLDKPGHPAPFLLAAAALQGHRRLNAWELWTVLRWYAHNRGYDGNSRWSSREQEDEDDTRKVSNARAFMRGYESLEELRKALGPNAPETLMPEFHTMAETVCACLKLDPAKSKKTISSNLPYKTLNTAYPRETVQREVLNLLEKHQDKIPGLDGKTLDLLFTPESLSAGDRDLLKAADIKLPKRYHGGLLFGQLVPRFDNRIISRCPITWAKVYDLVSEGLHAGENAGEKWHEFVVSASSEESRVDPKKSHAAWIKMEQAMTSLIAAGNTKEEAVRQVASKTSDKFAKVPAAKSKEFLEYRFAKVLANLRADGKPLAPDLRQQLFSQAKERGRFTASELGKEIESRLGKVETNLEAYFNIAPEAEKQLVLDPAKALALSNRTVKSIWHHLGDKGREKALETWRGSKGICPGDLLQIADDGGDCKAAETALKAHFDKLPKKETKDTTWHGFLKKPIKATYDSGRATYARPVLRRVVEEVMDGFDPNRSAADDEDANGRKKEIDGILYDLGIPGSRVRQLQNARPLDQLTNNHLVRHRMLVLERLVDNLVDEFVTNESPVSRVVVEVARELSQFSGMTAKQIASELNSRLKDFKSAVEYLEKAKEENPDLEINGSIIRKARIALDLNMLCPFTGKNYGPDSLRIMEREHIIPFATRNTNALHALVLTWPQVNRMKGKRTARQFILDCGGQQVPGMENLSIMSIGEYDAFVDELDVKGHPDDARRKKARKALLATTSFEDKELGFTDGALTQTSHLMKLATRGLVQRFPGAPCEPIPGPVTAEIRKAWNITGTLAMACPDVIDPNEVDENGHPMVRPKNDIRSLTHMHHALDAATIALAAHYFPLQAKGQDQKGTIWRILLKRNRDTKENEFLMGLGGIFDRHHTKEGKDEVRLKDLPKGLKNALARSLAQCRVAQHLPSDRSGAKAELTTWGVVSIEGEGEDARVKLRQNSSTVENGIRKRIPKDGEERAGKLLGIHPKQGQGKLKAIKGVMMIGENYGLALDPAPTVIPFHDVTARLTAIRKANDGKPVRVLRNGMLIRIDHWPGKEGIWRIMSCKASLKLDLARPQETKASWREVAISSLLARGLAIMPNNYAGHPRLE